MNTHPPHPHGHAPGALGAASDFDPSTSIAGTRREEAGRGDYVEEMHPLQIEMVKLQRHVIERREKVLVLVEGRDCAGKSDCLRHLVAHLNPRQSRVVALGTPSDRESVAWYFQRHVAQLPNAGEIVFFNRSWYNRPGIERVIGFCSKEELDEFFVTVPSFEQTLVSAGVKLLKLYLDVGRAEQARCLHQPA